MNQLKEELLKHQAEVNAAVERNLAAAGSTNQCVELVRARHETTLSKLIISKEPTNHNKWRLTSFCDDGLPWGHTVFDSREAAIRAASGEAFTDKVPGPPWHSAGSFVVSRVL